MPADVLIDANLLVLLVVGLASPDYIAKHKKLSNFDTHDFELAKEFLGKARGILVTPHSLTEVSNLARQIAEPARSSIANALRALIARSQEIPIASNIASHRHEYVRLGLTDAALIEAATDEVVLFTCDAELHLATLSAGRKSENFFHLKAAREGL